MKSSSGKGCLLGGFLGAVVFMVLVGFSHDVPDFGGAFVVPLFVLFFAGVGAVLGWLVGTPVTFFRPTGADSFIWAKGCGIALVIITLIVLVVGVLGRLLIAP